MSTDFEKGFIVGGGLMTLIVGGFIPAVFFIGFAVVGHFVAKKVRGQ